jgi:hypothetical protein
MKTLGKNKQIIVKFSQEPKNNFYSKCPPLDAGPVASTLVLRSAGLEVESGKGPKRACTDRTSFWEKEIHRSFFRFFFFSLKKGFSFE